MIDWRPRAPLQNLQLRAHILHDIREFFAARKVLEVETPLLAHTSVTDPYIHSIAVPFQHHKTFYLQTSPEYAMKRLLAAGSGSIYQICKAFRQDESGRLHNPEFTMLEWYRVGFDHHALMKEMDELLQLILKTPPAEKFSYAELFQTFLQINPHTATIDELEACAIKNNISFSEAHSDKDIWLFLLLSHAIEPKMGKERPCFIYDFPESQASLSRIQPGNPALAARFEVYFKGIELANGFHELQHADEQRKRFEHNLEERKRLGLNELPIDELLLAALAHGLPDCAGVALGLDRLIMLAVNADTLSEILSFTY